MKDVLSPEEFKKVAEAASRFRSSRPGPRRPAEDDVVERIMSFDKNKDGKVTKDELPERMQDLIARGDTNKDDALDNAEIKKLAADLARNDAFRRFDDRGGPGGRVGPGRGFPPGSGVERALD